MHQLRWGPRAALAAWMCLGCVRVVVGVSDEKLSIASVAVEPARPARGAGVVCGFSGDELVVHGAGWDPAAVEVRVGGTPLRLASAAAGELRAVVPVDTVEGDVTVVSGERVSRPAALRFCHRGAGHLMEQRFLGVVEPRLTIMASGVAGMPCPPVSATGGRCAQPGADGGVPDAGDDAHCAYLAGQQNSVAVTFGLGSTFTLSDPMFAARVIPEVGLSDVGKLPALDATARARMPHVAIPRGEAVDRRAFDPVFGTQPPGVLVLEELLLPDEQFVSHLLFRGTEVLSERSTENRVLLPQVMLSASHGVGLVASLAPLGPGGGPVSARVFGLDGSAPTEVTLQGEVAVAAGMVSGHWLERPGSVAALVVSREAGPTPTRLNLDILWTLPDGTTEQETGTPLTAEVCGHLAFADSCRACLRDLLTRRAGLGGVALELAPVSPRSLLLSPMRPVMPLQAVSETFCGVGFEAGTLRAGAAGSPVWALQELLGDSLTEVVSVAALPACTMEEARTALVPTIGGRATGQIWLSQGRNVSIRSARTNYAQLHADPVQPLFYAVPSTGGRVDLLDATGALARSAHVLGTARGVWPYNNPEDGYLVVWPDMVARLDSGGTLVQHVMKAAPTGAWPERGEDGDLRGLWLPQPDDGGALPTHVVQLDMRPGSTFGAQVESHALGTPTFFAPLARAGRWLVAVQDGPRDASPPCQTVLVALDLEAQSTPVVLACEPTGALADAVEPVLYAVEGKDTQSADLPYQFVLFDLRGGLPVRVPIDDTPAAVAAHPAGGLVGVFVDRNDYSLHLGQLLLDVGSTVAQATVHPLGTERAPLVDQPLVVSPDGRRLYAGLEGVVLEFELRGDPSGRLTDAKVVSQATIQGVPSSLEMDASGTRLVYLAPRTQEMGVLR